MMEDESSLRQLCLVTAILAFLYHALTAYLFTYLPHDSIYIYLGAVGYAYYGLVSSTLGIWGASKHSSDLLVIFSHHLFLDTILSAIPKATILYFFHDLMRDSCAPDWTSNRPSYRSAFNAGNGYISLSSHSQHDFSLSTQTHKCEALVMTAQLVVFGSLLLWTLGQWSLATSIRRYSLFLNDQSDSQRRDVEMGDRVGTEEKGGSVYLQGCISAERKNCA